ncbi:hypothetical protein MSG28_009603 [Choristoneura fumiferana]|uniref:Uncharacterized protein n=1 Tax=Choristoneura fumiferana TaxID=7141 RepID=A0ACC0JBS4_CHOFU|nr:hypothetical protein MSG28_009603 [Choristoneura fumiferana]
MCSALELPSVEYLHAQPSTSGAQCKTNNTTGSALELPSVEYLHAQPSTNGVPICERLLVEVGCNGAHWEIAMSIAAVDCYRLLLMTMKKAGALAEAAESKKTLKYKGLDSAYNFVAVGFETLGPWGPGAHKLIKEVQKRPSLAVRGGRFYRSFVKFMKASRKFSENKRMDRAYRFNPNQNDEIRKRDTYRKNDGNLNKGYSDKDFQEPQITNQDGALLDKHDSFYLTTKSLLVLFQIMGVMPIMRVPKSKSI